MKITLLLTFFLSLSTTATKLEFISLSNIHPTQAFVGYDQIPLKIEKIQKKLKKKKLDSYLKEKWSPAIIGPDEKYWILDRHHLSYALLKSDIADKYKGLYIRVLHDWSSYSWNHFYNSMKRENLFYLKNSKFEEISPEVIPTQVNALGNNPYRSLAYFAREKGCFNKVDIPYLEFMWGEFFYRSGLTIKESANNKKLIKKALSLCSKSSASHLPGFKH